MDSRERLALWSTDGSGETELAPGTQPVGPVSAVCIAAASLGGSAVFAGPNGRLWVTDGTAAGTRQLDPGSQRGQPYCPWDMAVL